VRGRRKLRQIGLIDRKTAERREIFRASGETDGKGLNMSAPGTQEMTAGIGLGLKPPLSPPVLSGPGAQAPLLAGVAADRLNGLPTPPPAIRPPEARRPAEEPVVSAARTEQPAQPEADLPSIAPVEDELPTMAPPEEETIEQRPPAVTAPLEDYFAEPADAVEAPIVLEPVRAAETSELPLIASPEPKLQLAPAPKPKGGFRLVVRLQDGERVEIGDFKDFGTAMEAAQEVIEQFTTAAAGTWPFYAGRFIRPDLIVSVDVVDAEQQP
jgi:hypothetical protein